MNFKVFSLIIINFLTSISYQSPKVDNFIHYIIRKFDPPESVQRVCLWQYVILKVKIDNSNKVTGYTIMNPVAKGLDSSFNFIRGYQFEKTVHWKRKNLMLCVGLENLRIDGCDTVTNDKHPTALMELRKFEKSYKKNDAVFIHKNIFAIITDRTP